MPVLEFFKACTRGLVRDRLSIECLPMVSVKKVSVLLTILYNFVPNAKTRICLELGLVQLNTSLFEKF